MTWSVEQIGRWNIVAHLVPINIKIIMMCVDFAPWTPFQNHNLDREVGGLHERVDQDC